MEQTLHPAVLIRWRPALLTVATLITSAFQAAHVCQATTGSDALDEIGYTRLVALLGSSTPNGAGVVISQVEASNSSDAYFPDDNSNHFTAATDPLARPFRVQNFSWIGSFSSDSKDRKAMRRFDYIIDTDDVTAVVGLNNNTDPLPHLLGHSYNAIAVGRTDGTHSTGPTQSLGVPSPIWWCPIRQPVRPPH